LKCNAWSQIKTAECVRVPIRAGEHAGAGMRVRCRRKLTMNRMFAAAASIGENSY